MIGNEEPLAGAKHILLIEDNPLNRELVGDLMRAYGYKVSEAISAAQALDWLEHNQPDLILMDLQLPGMDGLTLTGKLRQDPRWKSMPVVALTAFAMKGDREKAIEAGCSGMITKPIDTRAFPRQIEAYLQGYNERDADT